MNRPIAPDLDGYPDTRMATPNELRKMLHDAIRCGAQEKTENRRLRSALQEIAKQKILDEVEDPVCCDYEEGYTQCVEVARAAIKGENSEFSSKL